MFCKNKIKSLAMTNQTEVTWKDSWCRWLGCSLSNQYEQNIVKTCNYKYPRLEIPLWLVTFWHVIRSSLLQPNYHSSRRFMTREKCSNANFLTNNKSLFWMGPGMGVHVQTFKTKLSSVNTKILYLCCKLVGTLISYNEFSTWCAVM